MGEEKQPGYLSSLVRDGATPFARPQRGDAAFGGGGRFRQPFSPFGELQTEVESAPEISHEVAADISTDISTEILPAGSRESSSREPGTPSAPIYAPPARPDQTTFHSTEIEGAEAERVSISPTLEGHHEPGSRYVDANRKQSPTGASYVASTTIDEGEKVSSRQPVIRVREDSPAPLSESETAKRSDGSEVGARYRYTQDERGAQARDSHQAKTPVRISRSDVPHGDDHDLAARATAFTLSSSSVQAEPQTVAEKFSQDEQGDDRSVDDRSKDDANPNAAQPGEARTISPPPPSTSHKVFTHDLRHLFRGESRIAPDGELHTQKQTPTEGVNAPASRRRPRLEGGTGRGLTTPLSRAVESTEDNSERERQRDTEGRASSMARASASGELAGTASRATGSPASDHSMVGVQSENEIQTSREGRMERGLTTPPANVRAVRRRIDAAVRPASGEDGKSANQQSASGELLLAASVGAFTSSEGSGAEGGAHDRSGLAVAAAKHESREFSESLASHHDIAFGRRVTPEQDAPTRDAGAFSLKVNRLDVKLVNQAPKSPPAPHARTPSAQPKSEEYLERYYLGRFYLNL
jgi:hypothetical protein